MYAVEGEQKVYLLQSTLSAGKFTIHLLASIFMLPKGEAYSRRLSVCLSGTLSGE